MDSDNIIYIVIAIALALVNGLVQKKKKANSKVAPSSPVEINHQLNTLEGEMEDSSEVQSEGFEHNPNPFELLFGQNAFNKPPEEFLKPEVAPVEEKPIEEKPAFRPTDLMLRMQAKSQEFIDFKHEQHSFDFEKDSIASTAISNALSEEEEATALKENQSDMLKEFTGKKAVVYSEILRPKYFSLGVNN